MFKVESLNPKSSEELNKYEQRQLEQEIAKNDRLFARNKDLFEESKLNSCYRYAPCPICDKCLNKASHLYVTCQTCKIPICTHKYKDRVTMIKRNNFKITVSHKLFDKFKKLAKEVEDDDK